MSFAAYFCKYLIYHIPRANDPIEEFISLRDKLPRKNQSQIMKVIKQGK